jgi:hypothetical protein
MVRRRTMTMLNNIVTMYEFAVSFHSGDKAQAVTAKE